MVTPVALVVTGTPGVGKSTVCRAIAQRLPIAAHVEADTLHRFLVSGGQWPSAGTAAAMGQLVLRTCNAATVAANFVSAGIPVVLDEVLSTPRQVAVLAELLPGGRIVALTATEDVVLARDAMRSKHTAANYRGVASEIADAVGAAATWIDTTGLTAEETIAAVLRAAGGWALPAAAGRQAPANRSRGRG
ncbi:MAG TPA: AAA family ATPase [Acidimicrobiales bacterium]|jgi:predicted kinase|nr:AAA family ATPase [Acidimicrobiales bacterium]